MSGSWNTGHLAAKKSVRASPLWTLQDSVLGVCLLTLFNAYILISLSGAPAADFDRMVWGGRIAGIFFLADDYIDSGKMLDRIPGFKKAATGTGVCFLLILSFNIYILTSSFSASASRGQGWTMPRHCFSRYKGDISPTHVWSAHQVHAWVVGLEYPWAFLQSWSVSGHPSS